MNNFENQLIDDLVSLESQLSAEQRKKTYRIAKVAVPVVGIVGAVLPFLIGSVDEKVAAIIVGVVAVVSGVIHAVADNHTDPALYAPSLAAHTDLAVQDEEAAPPSPAPTDPAVPPAG